MNSHLESFLIFYLKILALPSGITILKSVVINYFRFNLLAACVAAAVSELKKGVSAAASAVVVGIGLLARSLSLLAEPIGTGRGRKQSAYCECLRSDGGGDLDHRRPTTSPVYR